MTRRDLSSNGRLRRSCASARALRRRRAPSARRVRHSGIRLERIDLLPNKSMKSWGLSDAQAPSRNLTPRVLSSPRCSQLPTDALLALLLEGFVPGRGEYLHASSPHGSHRLLSRLSHSGELLNHLGVPMRLFSGPSP